MDTAVIHALSTLYSSTDAAALSAANAQLMAVQDMDGQTGQVDAKKLNLPPPVVLRRESAAVQ